MPLLTRFAPALAVVATLSVAAAAYAAAGFDTSLSEAPVGRPSSRPGLPQVAMSDLEAFGFLVEAPPPVQPPNDADALPKVLQAYRAGDAAEGDILKSKLATPAAQAAAEWFALRAGINTGIDRVLSFQRDYPDWPVPAVMRRRVEETLLSPRRPAAKVRAFFEGRAPVSGTGRIALALALKADGLTAEAAELVRTAWREDGFGAELESRLLDEFPTVLTQADHRYRMERLLFREAWGGAQRAAARAGDGYESLVKARMGVFLGKKKSDAAFAAVPAALRSDSSYIFSRALSLRRQKKYVEAAAAMSGAPRDPEILAAGDEWWNERRRIARELLDLGDAKNAYLAASEHGAKTVPQRIEAEFHAGWIALRFLNDPAAASGHFAAAAAIAVTPISVARAAYWQGRAAEAAGPPLEAAGLPPEAAQFYARAADRPTTFYGQLAREKLRLPVALRRADPLDEAGRRSFEARVPVQAVKLFGRIGEAELALSLYGDLALSLERPAELDALAAIAEDANEPRAVLVVGKTALQRGFPLDPYAYPTIGFPSFSPVGDRVDPAMLYAIARQESAFNPKAVSSAGARGLMQLMPATAARTAKQFGVAFDVKRLVDDPSYNAKIGSAHLGELMEDWKGSYILAFASYNAGGGNVMKWVRSYGDPRKSQVDWVDWVERIPFGETRNYVQRVMENFAVYRFRLAPSATANALPKGEE